MKDTSFSNTERIKNKPFSKRIGDDLLERDKYGRVSRHFGFFNPHQIAFRQRMYEEISSNTIFAKLIRGEDIEVEGGE